MKLCFLTFFNVIFFTNFAFAIELLIQIKNNKFIPDTIEVQANQGFKLVIENLDKTAEEFESHSLNKEKIIMGGRKISILISPLEQGEYSFFGDFHPKTAHGKIIAK
jgi:hypothetical protein